MKCLVYIAAWNPDSEEIETYATDVFGSSVEDCEASAIRLMLNDWSADAEDYCSIKIVHSEIIEHG